MSDLKLKVDDLESTKYDVNEIVEDPRSARARVEAIITQAFLLAATFIILGVCYVLGASGDTKYIFGWPTWYALGVLMIFGVIVCGFIFCIKIYKCHKLEAVADDKEVD